MSIAPKLLQKLDKHTSDVSCMDFFGSSLLVTGSSDKTVRLFRWEVGSGFTEDSASPFLGHKYAVTQAVFSPKGSIIASSSVDGCVILWDLTGQKTDILYQPGGESIRNCKFAPDGSIIVTTDDTGLICIFGQDKSLKKTIKGVHEETVPTLAFTHDSKIMLTACTMGNVRFFFNDFEADAIEPDLLIDNAHDMGCMSADFCKVTRLDPVDANTRIYTLVTSGNDNKIKIWRVFSIADNKPARRGSRAGVSSDPHVNSRLISKTLQQHFSETATIFPTLYLNTECVHSFEAHGSSVTAVKFNNKGTLIVSGGLDRLIKIWNIQGNCLKTLGEHQRYVNCVAINIDSTIIASGSNDKSIQIWDLTGTFTLNSQIVNGIKSLLFSLTKDEKHVPEDFICPITYEIMTDPVMCNDGFNYERSAILEWFSNDKNTSPMTNSVLITTDVYDNEKLKSEIESYLKKLDFDPFQ